MICGKYYVVICIQHNLISKAYKVLQFFDTALLASSIGTLRKNIIIFTMWETFKSNKLRLVERRSMIYRFVWTFLWGSDHGFSKSAIKMQRFDLPRSILTWRVRQKFYSLHMHVLTHIRVKWQRDKDISKCSNLIICCKRRVQKPF